MSGPGPFTGPVVLAVLQYAAPADVAHAASCDVSRGERCTCTRPAGDQVEVDVSTPEVRLLLDAVAIGLEGLEPADVAGDPSTLERAWTLLDRLRAAGTRPVAPFPVQCGETMCTARATRQQYSPTTVAEFLADPFGDDQYEARCAAHAGPGAWPLTR